MALDRSKINDMTDEELKGFSENEDNHLYVDLDEEDDYNLEREYFYHDTTNCDACYTRSALLRRESERDSKKPGKLPAIYIPGKQSVLYKNVFASELRRGDFAAYHPNPGNDKIEYMECKDTVFDEAQNEYVTVWHLTNTADAIPHFARYSPNDDLGVYRILLIAPSK